MSLPDSSRLQWTPPPIGLRPLLQPGVGVRFSFVTDEQPVDTPNPVFVDPALTVVFTEATGDGPTFAKIDRAELSWMKMAGYWPIPENYCPSEQMDKFVSYRGLIDYFRFLFTLIQRKSTACPAIQ